MAKPPPEEFFEITYRCPKDQLGEEVAGLIRRGHDEVKYNLVTAVPTYAQRNKSGVNTAEFVAKWVEEHPTFKAIECVNAIKEATGNGGTAVYPALKVLVEKGVLKKLGEGNYAHAGVKQLAAPKKKITRELHKIDHREFILRYGRQHQGRMSVSKLRAHFEAHDRKPSSVSGAINFLLSQKMIKALGEGEYALLAKAAKPKPKPTANGGVEPTTEQTMTETSNG
jgi:Fe2+ or Zn2+ uptake regulation protein